MGKYRDYTDEDIIRESKKVTSLAQLLRALGLKEAGGNYDNMKRNLQRLGLTCDHWKGQGWSKDNQLKDWSQYRKAVSLKPHLITERGHRCELCERVEWMDQPITLEVHHIDADRTNNSYDNLQLLCPNCHSFTDSWRGRKNYSEIT